MEILDVMNLYDTYLPAMLWLRNDEADRLRDEFLLSSFPKFDNNVAVSGTSYQQLARHDLSLLAECKSHRKMPVERSLTLERMSSRDTHDELFLPPEEKSHGNTKTPSHLAGPPAYRHLHPAQRLPRTEEHINGLPACLVAGLHPSRTFQTSPAGSKSLDQIPQTLRAALRPPKEIHKSVTSQGATSNPHDGRANLSPSKTQKGRQRGSAQTFDPVQLAQIPFHYDFRKQAENQDLQACTSLSSEIPPLRVVSPFRFSGIFPASPAGSRSPDEIPQSLRAGLHSQKDIHKTVGLRSENFGFLAEVADLTSSRRQKSQQRDSTEKFDPVQSSKIPSHRDFRRQDTNQDLQANKSSSPEIPPLRTVSPFWFFGIFPTSSGNLDEISNSLQATGHPPKKILKFEISGAEFPNSLDGSNDVTPSKVQTHASSGRSHTRATSNIPSHDAFHKRIRRRKGYENLRMASTSHTIPSLPILSPLAFPDLSVDM
jgi:hypothetical protein